MSSVITARAAQRPKKRTMPRRAARPDLKPGRIWKSWEQFRRGGQEELAALKPGEIGQLLVKEGSYRIVREQDFQELYGLANDVDRLRGGLPVVIAAVRAVQQHRDASTVETLLEAVALIGDIPILPTRRAFEPPQPEGLELDPDDEVELDPAKVYRPYVTRSEE